jgi:hypothetical protein
VAPGGGGTGDIDTLWRGGLGSFAITATAIVHQSVATQEAIHAALERRAAVYVTPAGFRTPCGLQDWGWT